MYLISRQSWKTFKKLLERDRLELLETLTRVEDIATTNLTRGRIAQIDEMLAHYPTELMNDNEAAN